MQAILDRAVATLLLVALIVGTTVSAMHAARPAPLESDIVAHLDRPLVAALRDRPAPVVVESESFTSGLIAGGVLTRLVHAGIPAGFDPKWAWVVGDHYVVEPARAGTHIVVLGDGDDFDAWRRDPGYRELASYDTLSPENRAELTALRAEMSAAGPEQTLVWLRDHPVDAQRVTALSRDAGRGAVFERR